MKKVILLALLLSSFASVVLAQGNATIDPRITEVYGNYVSQLNAEQLAWLNTKLQRSEVRHEPVAAGEQYPKLSEQQVVTKYIPTLKMETTFDPAHINPLKYTLNFNERKDLAYRIDGTDYILFIRKKQ
jgi:inosine-uridine nucleoside N-ribohydrolase